MEKPLVTLGVPVYNEAKFIVESLECFLKQSYPNIEIIIADNGSTDETVEICKEYAAKHTNITYIHHPQNIGQHANFNYLVRCASGKYFCWASGHDVLEETFVENCVKVLESDENIVLAYPRTMNMWADGTKTREKVRPFDITKMSPGRRFREVMWRVDCNYVYGMWRLLPMLESKLFQDMPALDRIFLAEMAIKGTFAPADTFKYYRANRGKKVETELEKRKRTMGYLQPHKTFTDAELEGNKYHLPTRTGFLRVVKDAKFPFFERMHLYFSVWLSAVMKQHLFPGAAFMSVMVKKVLPKPLLNKLMSKMQ